jgi:hypothetical protein
MTGMAREIIERWRLAVLRAQLDLTNPTPMVATELVSYPGRTPHRLWTRRHPLEAFGLAEVAAPPGQLQLPVDLRDDIAASLAADLKGEAALWLRLTPPYGYLGAVPWEQSLLAVTNMPLLRVPDRLPVAADLGQVWSVAIAVSAPAASDWAAAYVAALVDEIAGEVRAKVDVHIFADAGTVAQLRELGLPEVRSWLHLHEPSAARRASEDRIQRQVPQFRRQGQDGRLVDPGTPGRIWADWIATGLAGRAVRALHVVLDATWDSDQPILALSPDPSEPSNAKNCAFVSADDVRLLADVLGAATLSFGSPPDATSDVAMRMIADGVGQQRPGATVYSSIRLDRLGAALAGTHRFLASTAGSLAGRSVPRRVPRHPSLFAYLQPQQIQASLADEWPEPPATTDLAGAASPSEDPLPSTVLPDGYQVTPETDLSDYYASTETVPTWVAASERYIGSQLANLSHSPSEPEPVGYKRAYERGAAEALAELQEIVAKHARPK